jgi:hypothetical protein
MLINYLKLIVYCDAVAAIVAASIAIYTCYKIAKKGGVI